MRNCCAILFFISSLGFVTKAYSGPLAYAVDTASNLYQLDLGTGARTLIGPTGVALPEGLAISPDGRLYATTVHSDLYELNRISGAATLIGNMQTGNVEGLDFSGDALLGVSYSETPFALSIDPVTAHTVEIRRCLEETGPTSAMASLDSDHMLIFSSRSGFGTLRRMNLTTGAVTSVGTFAPGTLITGLDFASDGLLYGVNSTGQVLRIDPTNANTTVIANHPGIFWLDMTTFVPEPSSVGALAMAAIAIGKRRYRRARSAGVVLDT